MAQLAESIDIRGQIETFENLTIDGRVNGPVRANGCDIVIGPSATITGDIWGRDITVFGAVAGTLVATEVVDIRETAQVIGRLIAPRVVLADGALFQGRVQPEQLHAALSVAQHRSPNLALARS
jgi:cytoskeletal protein CcmA (bactofilin family)